MVEAAPESVGIEEVGQFGVRGQVVRATSKFVDVTRVAIMASWNKIVMAIPITSTTPPLSASCFCAWRNQKPSHPHSHSDHNDSSDSAWRATLTSPARMRSTASCIFGSVFIKSLNATELSLKISASQQALAVIDCHHAAKAEVVRSRIHITFAAGPDNVPGAILIGA